MNFQGICHGEMSERGKIRSTQHHRRDHARLARRLDANIWEIYFSDGLSRAGNNNVWKYYLFAAGWRAEIVADLAAIEWKRPTRFESGKRAWKFHAGYIFILLFPPSLFFSFSFFFFFWFGGNSVFLSSGKYAAPGLFFPGYGVLQTRSVPRLARRLIHSRLSRLLSTFSPMPISRGNTSSARQGWACWRKREKKEREDVSLILNRE